MNKCCMATAIVLVYFIVAGVSFSAKDALSLCMI